MMKRFRGGESGILMQHLSVQRWRRWVRAQRRACPKAFRAASRGELAPLVTAVQQGPGSCFWRAEAGGSGRVCRETLKHLALGGREEAGSFGGWGKGGGGCSSGAELGHWNMDLNGEAQVLEMQVFAGEGTEPARLEVVTVGLFCSILSTLRLPRLLVVQYTLRNDPKLYLV